LLIASTNTCKRTARHKGFVRHLFCTTVLCMQVQTLQPLVADRLHKQPAGTRHIGSQKQGVLHIQQPLFFCL
jgi:hypothetical protein